MDMWLKSGHGTSWTPTQCTMGSHCPGFPKAMAKSLHGLVPWQCHFQNRWRVLFLDVLKLHWGSEFIPTTERTKNNKYSCKYLSIRIICGFSLFLYFVLSHFLPLLHRLWLCQFLEDQISIIRHPNLLSKPVLPPKEKSIDHLTTNV